MRTPTVPEPVLLKVWARALWPVLAFPVALVGLVLAAQRIGPVITLVSFTSLTLVMWVSVWTVVRDLPGLRLRAFRIGVCFAFFVVVMSGWTELSTTSGVVVPLAVAATSPPAVRLFMKVLGDRRRARSQRRRPVLPQRVLMDRELVDRRFEELVRDLEESGDNRDA